MSNSLTPYEQQRLKNIEFNKELLSSLNIDSARGLLNTIDATKNEIAKPANQPRKTRKGPPKKDPVSPLPMRKSSRLKGEKAPAIEIDKENNIELLGDVKDDPRVEDILDSGRLLTAEEYFNEETKKKAINVDGHFRSWVNPAIMKRHGIEASAEEAWEKNGGGTFSFLDPTGSGKKRKRGSSSNAKSEALKMFKKNPNQYFYRHNEPGEDQWVHDWSNEEKELFLNIAKEHGCGDKWGLFASYVPHRFGYQCSSFYRHEIIKNGLVFDPNFQFTPSGEPVFVGARRGQRG